MYTQRWFTKGSIIAVNDMLCCYEEKGGNLGLVRPDPTKFDLVSSFRIVLGKGPHFAYPSFAKGVLYVRHGDVLIAYDIGQKSVSATNQPWIAK